METLEPALFAVQTPQPPLPPPPPPPHEPGPIELATVATLDKLKAEQLITGKYVAIAAALLSTARAVDEGMKGGPKGVTVATAQLNKMLLDGLNQLPEPLRGHDPVFDALDEQIKAMTHDALGVAL